MNDEPELISVYTREQEREAGIKFPIAATTGTQGILNDIGDSGKDELCLHQL